VAGAAPDRPRRTPLTASGHVRLCGTEHARERYRVADMSCLTPQQWQASSTADVLRTGRHRVRRRTIRQAPASAVPPARKPYPQRPALHGSACGTPGSQPADRVNIGTVCAMLRRSTRRSAMPVRLFQALPTDSENRCRLGPTPADAVADMARFRRTVSGRPTPSGCRPDQDDRCAISCPRGLRDARE
jgi:hypothetical protein